jgi:adenylate cyclase
VGELGRLQAGFNAMVLGLRERRRIEDLFGRLVGADVARQAMARDPELGGEERTITALFVDRAGFTAYAEQHSPTEIVAELNRFFAVVIDVVEAEGGWVNKFEGDAALCLFGTPADQPDHAARALRAAWRLPAAVAALPHAPLVGVGVATGPVVAGHIGTRARHEYTVIGDAVNVAARLTDLAKGTEAHVLAAGTTVASAAAAGEDVGCWRSAGPVQLRGRSAAIERYEPAPSAGDLRAQASEVGLPSGPQS